MDRPVLHAFVRELVENEQLAAFADDLPQRARVSEAALPVVLASLHERLQRPLVCLVPEDVDARPRRLASERGLSQSAVIVEAIRALPDAQGQMARVLAFSGTIKVGPRRRSEDVDQTLYGTGPRG